MKKTVKLLTALFGVFAMILPTACGQKDENLNSATNVQLYYWKSGYGLDFIQRIVNEYNSKQTDYVVTLDYDSNAATILSTS